jgi:glutamine transport system permease protein
MIDFPLIIQSMPTLLKGMGLSIQIAFFSGIIGLFVGGVVGVFDSMKKVYLNPFIRLYVTLFRGTPMLIQILFAYYVLPQMGIRIEAKWTAILAIGLNSGAYISQIILSGINAVSIGQLEAGESLGLTKFQVMSYIVMPQALRIVFPALGNEMITLMKDSSLASVIGVVELSKAGSIIRSNTYDAFSVLFAVACVYLLMTIFLSWLLEKFEKRMSHVES